MRSEEPMVFQNMFHSENKRASAIRMLVFLWMGEFLPEQGCKENFL